MASALKKMSNSPAYLWYPRDVFDSERVEDLSPAEECWYRRALDRCWGDEGISADPVKAAKRIGKKCTVKAAEMILKTFFIPKKNDPTRLVNERQEKERKKLIEKKKQRSTAGKKGMANRWKEKTKSDNTVITPLQSRNNISIPISSSISNQEKEEEKKPDATAQAVFVGTVLAGIKKELGLVKLTPTQEHKWTPHINLAFENGFTADEFIRCLADLRQRHSYPILPEYVTDRLPDFTKRNKTVEVLPTADQKIAEAAANDAAIRSAPKPITVGVVQ